MSLLRKFRETTETFTNLTADRWPGLPRDHSGSSVSQASSLRMTAVYACVRLISETVASLPIHVYERVDGVRRRLDPPQWLIQPNPEMTTFELFERVVAALNLDGNAFLYFERDRLGRIGVVWPVHPELVHVYRDKDTRQPRYQYAGETFDPSNMLHIRAFSGAGSLRGLSPIGLHRQAIGLGMAAEEYGARFFGQGGHLSGVIEVPGDVKKDQLDLIATHWNEDHRGLERAHEPGFLTGGMTWKPLTLPNDQAQYLETRKFQVTEITRIFRCPPHKISDLERATFSNIEHSAIEWVVDGVRPWLVRLEHALRPLIPDGYQRFIVEGLLRGDTVSRYAAYASALNNGHMNVDEVRELEDRDPLPAGAGQVYRTPLNLAAVNGDLPEPPLTDKVNAAGALVRAGYDPAGALELVGLDPIEHLGLLPVTVQAEA